MAACDANYRFTFVDIGGYGHDSDRGTFARYALGQLLEEERLEIPGEATDIALDSTIVIACMNI